MSIKFEVNGKKIIDSDRGIKNLKNLSCMVAAKVASVSEQGAEVSSKLSRRAKDFISKNLQLDEDEQDYDLNSESFEDEKHQVSEEKRDVITKTTQFTEKVVEKTVNATRKGIMKLAEEMLRIDEMIDKFYD